MKDMKPKIFQVGDIVRANCDQSTRKDVEHCCFKEGQTYRVTAFVLGKYDNHGVVLDRCSAEFCIENGNCTNIERYKLYGHWATYCFDLVSSGLTPEEEASAQTFTSVNINEAEEFFRHT